MTWQKVQHPIPAPGSLVWIRRRRWRVESTRRDRNVLRLDVVGRERRMTFLAPFDRLWVEQPTTRLLKASVREAAARLAGLLAGASSARGIPAALSANVEVIPYQLEPALAVADGIRRLLIADEVGLGKTIQAAVVLADLKRRRSALRAMVIVPRSLRDQWRQELHERFGLSVTIADRDGLEGAARSIERGHSPWSCAGVWIVSADYLKQPHVFDAIPLIAWDIVVVDEAHDACGDSARHEATNEIARRARHVLLLTATPHTGDEARFERLERLGQLDGIDPLLMFRRTRGLLGLRSRRRVRWVSVRPTPAESLVFEAVCAFERAIGNAVSERQREGALLLLSIFRKRALSTMTALQISVERRLSWVSGRADEVVEWMQPRLGFEDDEDGRSDDDCAGLTMESGLSGAAERAWLRRLLALTAVAARRESKVRHIVGLLGRTREPVVIFTEFRHSLDALRVAIERAFPGQRRLAMLHGGLSPVERANAIETFQRGDVGVLLATDVASQGLNLQSRARWVISLELPWTTARIEQRIGRVDRIGQTRSVHATLLVAAHPAEQGLLAALARRTLFVRRVMGGDALAGLAPPSERAVAHDLLHGGSTLEDDRAVVSRTIVTADRWRRPARAVARHLLLKRALMRRWRAPDVQTGRARFVMLRRRNSSSGHMAVVVSVPIADGTGLLVERRLLCLGFQGVEVDDVRAIVGSNAFREWVADRLHKRLACLRRRAICVTAARAAVDEAIARHLIGVGWPVELQTGLFDRRNERAFVTARDEALAIERSMLIQRHNSNLSCDLDIAAPSLELIVSW